jgi:hypothetical protein
MKPLSERRTLTTTILLFGLASLALAHGHDDGEMLSSGGDSGLNEAAHTASFIDPDSPDMGPPNYFRHSEHSGLMLAHIVLMSVGWIFILPLGMSCAP